MVVDPRARHQVLQREDGEVIRMDLDTEPESDSDGSDAASEAEEVVFGDLLQQESESAHIDDDDDDGDVVSDVDLPEVDAEAEVGADDETEADADDETEAEDEETFVVAFDDNNNIVAVVVESQEEIDEEESEESWVSHGPSQLRFRSGSESDKTAASPSTAGGDEAATPKSKAGTQPAEPTPEPLPVWSTNINHRHGGEQHTSPPPPPSSSSSSSSSPCPAARPSYVRVGEGGGGARPKVFKYPSSLSLPVTVIPPCMGPLGSNFIHPDNDNNVFANTTDNSNSNSRSVGMMAPVPLSVTLAQQTFEESGSSTASSVMSWASTSSTSQQTTPLERKSSKHRQQPKGTFQYEVKDGDTLDRIGARFEVTPSELMKINRLLSRTVFAGMNMYIPDPNAIATIVVPTPTTSTCSEVKVKSPQAVTSPVAAAAVVVDTRPKVDVPLANLGDRSPPAIPGHVVQITTSPVFQPNPPTQDSDIVDNELDRECQQKFIKIRSRRVLEEHEHDTSSFGGVTCRGTLLVTPNAIMFDPDVNDTFVISNGGQAKFSAVVYMENVKSACLYPDMSPRIFWKQPQEIRSRSPRPEPYKPGPDDHRDSVDGASSSLAGSTRQAPDGISTTTVDSNTQRRHSPEGGNDEVPEDPRPRKMSDEMEDMTEMTQSLPVFAPQPGRASEEVEHMLTSFGGFNAQLQQQMSRSSELAGSEIALLDEVSKEIGFSRDFGPHMGRSSSEMSKQGLPGNQGLISISSPRESVNSGLSMDRSDSTNDNLNTPTQGFAPVFFTDRSPNSAIAAPKPVSGHKSALHLSELGSVSEDPSSGEKRLSGDGHADSDKSPVCPGEAKSDSAISDVSEVKDAETRRAPHDERPAPLKISSDVHDITGGVERIGLRNESREMKQEVSSDSVDGRLPPMPSGSSLDGTPKSSSISSPLSSSFSPLRTPAQHISSFFNYTTGFFRGSDKEKNGGGGGTPGATPEDSPLNKISKNLPSFQFPSSLIPGAFSSNSSLSPLSLSSSSTATSTSTAAIAQQPTAALMASSAHSNYGSVVDGRNERDLSQMLGPPISSYLPRSDSPQFLASPMYLQIRTGVPNNQDPDIPKRHAIVRRISGRLMEEYWFVIPRDMTQRLYNFLISWQPDAYGDQEATKNRERYFYDPRDVGHLIQHSANNADSPATPGLEIYDDYYADDLTWEIVGCADINEAASGGVKSSEDDAMLPKLVNGPSSILKDEHLAKIIKVLPRTMTVGYDWALVFSTGKHGFSLQHLYREMNELDSDYPVILCLLDTDHIVFGAYLSNTIQISEAFYGSGTTFLFTFHPEFKSFHWQGDNNFFMNGTKEMFSIGSGSGHFGLWLDNNLDKGGSQTCATFGNDLLTPAEDFNIVNVEVWQFIES